MDDSRGALKVTPANVGFLTQTFVGAKRKPRWDVCRDGSPFGRLHNSKGIAFGHGTPWVKNFLKNRVISKRNLVEP
ncbi:hypothetical protein MPNT_10019 [Candidatus Methylacidithermus pantelleriae]|uniref:Uncharacterized protein n=1 Tax=Candidatus Methylacidithermus pantelleriae TaxID=2744239 RepID=A0A8J2BI96_9BACT|nr:hypothetical protein MPNT_10019 [Candidatus Methylacidithermus pantelleriae]